MLFGCAASFAFFGFVPESTTVGFIAVKFKCILVLLKFQLVRVMFFGCTERQTLAFLRPVKAASLKRALGFGAHETTAHLSSFVVHGYTDSVAFTA